MKSNRRSVLIGLGALTVGGGAVFGTGAFSSVEADRSVSINTAGDGSALLGLEVTDTLDDGDDTISFELGSDVNIDAVTMFEGGLTISNNNSGTDSDIGDLDVTVEGGSENLLINDSTSSSGDGLQFESQDENVSGNDTDTITISPDSSEIFDIVFDFEGVETQGDATIPDTITFTANPSN